MSGSIALKHIIEFFRGKAYPILIGVLLFIGHSFAIEFYTNILIMLLFSAAVCLCKTAKPIIVVLCGYIYQLSVKNSPSMPSFSDYYFTGGRGAVIILLFVIAGASIAYSSVKNWWFTLDSLRVLPLLPSALILSLAFLLNGAFSGVWVWQSAFYGALQIVAYFLIFYLFILGLKKEDNKELSEYFVYVTAIIALVLIAETIHLYLTNDLLVAGGEIDKGQVLFGWGIWTTAGMDMSVLIPVLFLGVVEGRKPWFYFTVATMVYVCVIFTMSRNALLFATLAYAACIAISCTRGCKKAVFRRVALTLAALALSVLLLFVKPIMSLLSDYVELGFSDNGRFSLWRYGIECFTEAPVFGKGFFALETDTFRAEEFFPPMLHNTVVQLMASMGLFGLLAYGYYRISTLKPFFCTPTVSKSLLGISMLVLIGESLFDNFVFHVQPMFYYSVTLAVVYKLDECA